MKLENVKEVRYFTGEYKAIDPLFGHNCKRIELDLGCGKGGFSLELARRNPDTLVLAADIKANRLKRINNKAAVKKIDNIETLRVMAWDLIAYMLPDNSLDRIHVLNPDPWPKARHSANRLLSSEFLGRMIKVLKPGGILHLSTDDKTYLSWIEKAISPIKEYESFIDGIEDVRDIKSEFELIYIREGKEVTHLSYRLNK